MKLIILILSIFALQSNCQFFQINEIDDYLKKPLYCNDLLEYAIHGWVRLDQNQTYDPPVEIFQITHEDNPYNQIPTVILEVRNYDSEPHFYFSINDLSISKNIQQLIPIQKDAWNFFYVCYDFNKRQISIMVQNPEKDTQFTYFNVIQNQMFNFSLQAKRLNDIQQFFQGDIEYLTVRMENSVYRETLFYDDYCQTNQIDLNYPATFSLANYKGDLTYHLEKVLTLSSVSEIYGKSILIQKNDYLIICIHNNDQITSYTVIQNLENVQIPLTINRGVTLNKSELTQSFCALKQ